ncbi:MAG: metallophosphoesterase [Caldilineaceae bacterium]|nr:metallophosphoesterase [Caldilineaceae bacterium]
MIKKVHHRRWTHYVILYMGGVVVCAMLLLCAVWILPAQLYSALNENRSIASNAASYAARPASSIMPVRELTRFAVIGDYGVSEPDAKRVADLVKSWQPDFIVTTGDNNYEKGLAEDMDPHIGAYYRSYIAPYLGSLDGQNSGEATQINRFFPSLGNHDWESMTCRDGLCAGPYLDYFTLPGNERYYSLERGRVRIFVLDSDPHEPDGITPLSNQAMWLRDALENSTATWNLAITHHAPFSSGSRHGSHKEMQWPYAQWGIDAVLSGHDHIYERLELGGITYFVNGLGGKSRHPFRLNLFKGSQFTYNSDYGAMLVEADDAQITFQFVNPDNEVVDTATLYATATPTPPVPSDAQLIDIRIASAADHLIEQAATGVISYPLGELVTDANMRTYLAGGRFPNVQIPPCATILSASIEFAAAETSDKLPALISIFGENSVNVAPFDMTPYNLSHRAKTSHNVSWNIGAQWETVGESHWTPDLTPIVQEIVSQPGWVSGNALAFFFSGAGDRSVVAYNMQPLAAPRLVIHFEPLADESEPAPAGTIPILSNHQIYLPITAVQYCN